MRRLLILLVISCGVIYSFQAEAASFWVSTNYSSSVLPHQYRVSGIEGTAFLYFENGVPCNTVEHNCKGGRYVHPAAHTVLSITPALAGKAIDKRGSFMVTTDQNGNFFVAVPPGKYFIDDANKQVNPVGVTIPSGTIVHIDIKIREAMPLL